MIRNQEYDWNSVKEEIIDDVLLTLNQDADYSDNTQCDDLEYDITVGPDDFVEVVKEEQIYDEIEAPAPLAELNVKDKPSDVISGDVKEELMDHGKDGPPELDIGVELNDGAVTSKSEDRDVSETSEGMSSNYNLCVTHNKRIVCDVCGHFTYQEALMKLHMMEHMLVRGKNKENARMTTATALVIPKNSSMLNSLSMKISGTDNNTPVEPGFICHICEHETDQKHLLKRHMMTHTGEKPFACELCDYCSVRKSGLKKHLMIHTGEKRFACDLCGHRTSSKYRLKIHLMVHTGEKPFACDLCGHRTSRKHRLKNHLMIHTGEKPFACKLCDYFTVTKSNLKNHLMSHTGEKPFACEFCYYRCAKKSRLKEHVMIHTGEKRFACDLCDHRTSSKYLLKNHLMIHTGEKPFACELCDYFTVTKSNLKNHLMSHTGEKPFACEFCYYRCAQKSSLKEHMARNTHPQWRDIICL